MTYQNTSVNLDAATIERLSRFSDDHGLSTLRGPNLSAAIRMMAEMLDTGRILVDSGVEYKGEQ